MKDFAEKFLEMVATVGSPDAICDLAIGAIQKYKEHPTKETATELKRCLIPLILRLEKGEKRPEDFIKEMEQEMTKSTPVQAQKSLDEEKDAYFDAIQTEIEKFPGDPQKEDIERIAKQVADDMGIQVAEMRVIDMKDKKTKKHIHLPGEGGQA